MMNKLDISVIVPVYNAENFIERALNSLTIQNVENIEFICIDDGSEDSSLEILQNYSVKDKRFRIFHKDNEGVSKARNYGLEQARGDYIMFLDADDWYDENTCRRAFEVINKNKCDLGMFCMTMEYETYSRYCKILQCSEKYFNNEECKELYRKCIGLVGKECSRIMQIDYLSLVYLKIYKKSIIEENNIRFRDIHEIGSFEDGLFNLEYFKYIQSAYYLLDPLYHYNRINQSSITTKYRTGLSQQWEKLFEIIENKLQLDNFDEFAHALKNRKAYAMATLGLNLIIGNESIFQKYKKWKELFHNNSLYRTFDISEIAVMPKSIAVFFFLIKIRCTSITFILLWVMQYVRKRRRS